MAPLPPLPDDLPPATRAAIERNAAARAHADGRPHLSAVYAALFHQPALAEQVGALGEQLRFGGVLPDDVRELAILRISARLGFGYEWSHHQRPATLAGLTPEVVDHLTRGAVPGGLRADQVATLRAVDAVVGGRSIPADDQAAIVAEHGEAGAVELACLCGLYALMGYVCGAFDIELEEGLPPAPFTGPVTT